MIGAGCGIPVQSTGAWPEPRTQAWNLASRSETFQYTTAANSFSMCC